jgi:hypothetical protein
MEKIKNALAEYILVLRDSQTNCKRAEDRDTYTGHLAAAAVMLAEVCQGYPIEKLIERVKHEEHSYGWGYLSYEEGEAAEMAFNKLASLIKKYASRIES